MRIGCYNCPNETLVLTENTPHSPLTDKVSDCFCVVRSPSSSLMCHLLHTTVWTIWKQTKMAIRKAQLITTEIWMFYYCVCNSFECVFQMENLKSRCIEVEHSVFLCVCMCLCETICESVCACKWVFTAILLYVDVEKFCLMQRHFLSPMQLLLGISSSENAALHCEVRHRNTSTSTHTVHTGLHADGPCRKGDAVNIWYPRASLHAGVYLLAEIGSWAAEIHPLCRLAPQNWLSACLQASATDNGELQCWCASHTQTCQLSSLSSPFSCAM